jgi:hypothetical protein
MPIISKYQEVEAIDEIEKRTAEGLSFAFEGTFLRFITPFIRATMSEWNVLNAEFATIPFTMDSIQKLYRHVSVTGTRSTREINKTD